MDVMRHLIALSFLAAFVAVVVFVAAFFFYVVSAILTVMALCVLCGLATVFYWGADEVLQKWKATRP